MTTRVRRRWVIIILAAVRLAAIYAVGVLLLVVPFVIGIVNRIDRGGNPWLGLSTLPALGFAFGFIALAVARRVGFALLWVLLLWWWLRVSTTPPFFIGLPFVAWTVFAMPLYVLSAIGLSSGRRWIQVELLLTLVVWAILVVLTLRIAPFGDDMLIPYGGHGLPTPAINYVCVAWPFAIGARELIRVAFALRPSSPAAA